MPDSVGVLTDRVAALGDSIDELLLTVASLDGPGADTDPRARTDDRLREFVVGLQRVCNAAEAAQADALVAMGEEARQLDAAEFAATGMPLRSHEEFVPDEIGVLLACTKAEAGRRYGLALRSLDYPALTEAWQVGHVDARKVKTITDELTALSDPEVSGGLSPAQIAEVTEHLSRTGVEYARTHTWSQTRTWLRRRVLKVAPEVAELRRGRAEQQRRVQITPADDGMSELWAWLPSVQARQIQQALTTAAHDLGAGDARTMDQRRADLLVAWLLGPDHAPTVHLHLIAEPNASTSIPGDAGAWLPGVGTLTELQTSDLLGSARTVLVANPSDLPAEHSYRPSRALDSAIRARDVTCRFPGCRRSALGTGTGTDLDHTIPWPQGPTATDNLAVLCRRHHQLKHSPRWHVELSPDGTMTWTTPSGRTYITEPWSSDMTAERSGDINGDTGPPDRSTQPPQDGLSRGAPTHAMNATTGGRGG